jgi:tetratricopeptide (TPR) repeat protein
LAADSGAVADLLRRADELDAKQEVAAALKLLEEANAQFPNHAEILIRLAKQQSNQIFAAKADAEKKRLAALCLVTADRAVAADTNSARARLSVGICLAKNFPYVDNQTKVNYSRRLKEETERAIALDPKLDLAYHMLARWHFEVAEMNFILRGIAKLVYGGIPKGTLEDARVNFEKALALAPKRVIHRHQLAQTLLALRKKPDAVAQLQHCLTLAPADKDDAEAQQAAAKQLRELGVATESKPLAGGQ